MLVKYLTICVFILVVVYLYFCRMTQYYIMNTSRINNYKKDGIFASNKCSLYTLLFVFNLNKLR